MLCWEGIEESCAQWCGSSRLHAKVHYSYLVATYAFFGPQRSVWSHGLLNSLGGDVGRSELRRRFSIGLLSCLAWL